MKKNNDIHVTDVYPWWSEVILEKYLKFFAGKFHLEYACQWRFTMEDMIYSIYTVCEKISQHTSDSIGCIYMYAADLHGPLE